LVSTLVVTATSSLVVSASAAMSATALTVSEITCVSTLPSSSVTLTVNESAP